MFDIGAVLKDVTERAASTGWQVAAGYAIAENVFHNVALTPLVAAVLSIVKCAAVWFYANHKATIDRNVGDVDELAAELKPIVEQMVSEMAGAVVGIPSHPAELQPGAVTPAPQPAADVEQAAAAVNSRPAAKRPPFLRK